MKTFTPTPSEMQCNIARFSQLRPKSRRYAEQAGIPAEAFEMIAAKSIYLLMAPQGAGGANASPAEEARAHAGGDEEARVAPPRGEAHLARQQQLAEREETASVGEHLRPNGVVAAPAGVRLVLAAEVGLTIRAYPPSAHQESAAHWLRFRF